VIEIALAVGWEAYNARAFLARFDVQNCDVFRTNRGFACRQCFLCSLADTAKQTKDEMLAVRFQDVGILLLAEGRFDEDVCKFGL